ncbi:MAG: hypothetical protein K6T74_10025, partial [Geminicoccaceae bacterium]|nr:hypothetical protein [Geminicoccaceae bacterium]
YPTSDQLPENQLRFYIHFSAPMSRGEAYARIRLLDSAGKPIDAAFLELGEELWDPSGKRFTLLIDPGRIKRGLRPREDLGPVLEAGSALGFLVFAPLKERESFQIRHLPDHSFRFSFFVNDQHGNPDLVFAIATTPSAGGGGLMAGVATALHGHARVVAVEPDHEAAARELRCPHRLAIVPGATHLFEEPGALEQVAELARDWFLEHLAGASGEQGGIGGRP